VTPPLGKERLPRNFHHCPPTGGSGVGSSSSDSLDHPHHHRHGPNRHHSAVLTSTPKLSSISGAKTDDTSMRTTSSSHGDEETEPEADRSEDMSVSISNASDQEREWVEEDDPGVYITIRALPGGIRELRRVRFRLE
jgi:Transcription factor regulating root and shoot growth via Pin3